MATQLLSTKLYVPASRPGMIRRSRLIDRLNAGMHGKLTLASAPAGFGKTTLITEWIRNGDHPTAWLSLDEADSDPIKFFIYFVAALQTIEPRTGTGIMKMLEAPQPPAVDSLLTALLNNIMITMSHNFLLVLDDYHVLESTEIDSALTFLIDNQPPQMHLVITTREDPRLPLARLRVRGQLTELRAADLRFTSDEAAEFLNNAMGLRLSSDDISALEARTEGWIAGLQLAAISMRGQTDIGGFITSFTGSHHFVLDYLIEEVLNHQPPHIHDFLLKTSILERLCGPLCDAVLRDESHSATEILEHIRNANLFLVPLDNERYWYRYHHLFGDLLRKRLGQSSDIKIKDLHLYASQWYAANGFEYEAFQHAVMADDHERAEHLVNGADVPLYFRGIAQPILRWLEALSTQTLDARPSLWVIFAWTLMVAHRNTQIEDKLQMAEAALANAAQTDHSRDLLGQIAAIRAMDAAIYHQPEVIITQAKDALDLLHADNLYIRTVVMRSLAIAYQFRGEWAAARETYKQAIAMSETSNNYFINVLATTGLGIVQEAEAELYKAVESYQRVLDLVDDPSQPITCAAYLGLARIYYEWNELEPAQEYGAQGVLLARQIESIDSAAGGEIFLAKLKLAQGDRWGASTMLDEIARVVHKRHYVRQIPVIAEVRISLCLKQGDLKQAASLADAHDLPLSQARVALKQGNEADALELLSSYLHHMEAKNSKDKRLKGLILQALAYDQTNHIDEAISVMGEALAFAVSGGFMRTFLDEGQPMQKLLFEVAARGVMPEYVRKLLAAFQTEPGHTQTTATQPLVEPLSERELEVLTLVAEGLSNREICERLFISLSTVKGHNRNIFDKLQVKRRTEAVARAHELGLI